MLLLKKLSATSKRRQSPGVMNQVKEPRVRRSDIGSNALVDAIGATDTSAETIGPDQAVIGTRRGFEPETSNTTKAGFKATLRMLKESLAGIQIQGLTSAVGGLLAVLEGVEVSVGSLHINIRQRAKRWVTNTGGEE